MAKTVIQIKTDTNTSIRTKTVAGSILKTDVAGRLDDICDKIGELETEKILAGRQTGTLATDGTIALVAGRYYSRIILRPAAPLAALKIGTIAGGDDILPEMLVPVTPAFNAAINIYQDAAGAFYVTGVTSVTQYILFYE